MAASCWACRISVTVHLIVFGLLWVAVSICFSPSDCLGLIDAHIANALQGQLMFVTSCQFLDGIVISIAVQMEIMLSCLMFRILASCSVIKREWT